MMFVSSDLMQKLLDSSRVAGRAFNADQHPMPRKEIPLYLIRS